MSGQREALIEVLAAHRYEDASYVGGGHGTMGMGKAWCTCRTAIGFDWYEEDASTAHRSHLADAILAALPEVIEECGVVLTPEWIARTEADMRRAWGYDAAWLTTGTIVASLVAEWLSEEATP